MLESIRQEVTRHPFHPYPYMQVRTRIAPSPTGENLHIGNAYTALVNYVFARQNQGRFIIRIEDTDRTRLVEGSEKRILASLDWLGIPHDEGPDKGGPYAPYRQSDRLDIYKKHAEELIAGGHAFYCFCSGERLADMRKRQESEHKPPMYDGTCRRLDGKAAKSRAEAGEPHVIRLNVPDEGVTRFTDVIRGEISFENALIDDQVLLKSDGFPTYHLGVVVDDHLMNISHIIRGEEWISSTPKHILLYDFFGWEKPVFAHMPLLRNPDRSKLSKRKNPVWVSWYRDEGFLPEAVRNYLATLAWAHPGGREVFDLEEMIRVFDIGRIQTTAPIFNTEKLRWLNGEYLRGKDDRTLQDLVLGFEKRIPSGGGDMLPRILPLVRERMKTLSEFWQLASFFFERPVSYEQELDAMALEILQEVLPQAEWNHVALEKLIREAAAAHGMKAKDLFMQLRISVTGRLVGPPLLESLEILGKGETVRRITP